MDQYRDFLVAGLQANGATVDQFQLFGDPESGWFIALVTKDQKTFFVKAPFYSDLFTHWFKEEEGGEQARTDAIAQLCADYLTGEVGDRDQMIKIVSQNISWDSRANEAASWLRAFDPDPSM